MKTSNYLLSLLAGVSLAVGVPVLAGCRLLVVGAAGAAGAGIVAYADGKLNATLGNSYDTVVAATRQAITQLEFAQPEERKDELSDTFVTHNGKGDRVEIDLNNAGDNVTKVSIRVNTFGDQQMSMAILDKIKSNL
jgi:hypothetical protein